MGRRHLVRRQLHRFGQPITIRRVSGGTFDPVESEITGTTTRKDVPTKGVFMNFTIEEVDGTEIQHTDRKVIVSIMDVEETFVPRSGDVIIDANEVQFLVHKIRVLDADKAYMIHVRGG